MSHAIALTDYQRAKIRTRWSMGTSMVLHALLMLLIVTWKSVEDPLPSVTEITMIDPGQLAPASSGSPAAPAAPGPTASGARNPGQRDERFARLQREADFMPEPVSKNALEDRLAAQMATLDRREVTPVSSSAASGLPGGSWGAASVPGGTGTGAGPLSLTRGGTGGTGTGLRLTRGGGTGTGIGPAVVSTGVPGGAGTAPAKGSESTARRNLAGATLMGPIADRPVITYATPIYPEWAKKDAVEGSVTLYFVVRPDGTIKENVLIQKTAGFEDFDENARQALRAWKFQPLTGGRTGEQWGTITFHFRLREAG